MGNRDKINVLYLHAQNDFKADSTIHGHIIRHLDRERFVPHIACTKGDGASIPECLTEFQKIPNVRLRPTAFAPGFRERSLATIATSLGAAALFPVDFAALVAYIVRERIQIIHSPDRPRDSVYAVVLAQLTRAKSVVHVHVKWSEAYSAPAKWAIRKADGVFSISDFVTESLRRFGKPGDRIHTILNAIDTANWDPEVRGDGVRREFGIEADAPLLVSVSRLFAEKGQPELLSALPLVRERVPNVKLLIVGDETPFSRGFVDQLKRQSEQLGVADAVVFTGPRSDIAQVMAASDVFCLPSYEEPFGLVYLEAMAMRRPVVALANGGTPEVVEHGQSGLLSDYRDIPKLAQNIVELLTDGQLRTRLGSNGRARVLEHFDAKRMARDAARAYERVLSS